MRLLALLTLAVCPALAAAAPLAPNTTRLPNGIAQIVRVDRTSPRVAVSIMFRLGATEETTGSAGWRRLLADSMLRAVLMPAAPGAATKTETWDAARLLREAEALGGRIGISVGDDNIEFWAAGDSASLERLLGLLLDVVYHPRLGDEDIEAARKRLLARLEDENNDVIVRAVGSLRGQLYRTAQNDLSAYGLPGNGSVESLGTLSPQKIRDLYGVYLQSASPIVAATGDVDEATLSRLLASLPTPTGNTAAAPPPYFAAPSGSQPPLVVRQMRTSGAWVFAAYILPDLDAADLPALRVLTAALGEAPPSRLSHRLLGKRQAPIGAATASQAAVQFTSRRYAGELIAFALTGTQNVDQVKNALIDEVHKITDTPLPAWELTRAKNYVRGLWSVERENLHERAAQTALALVNGAPPDADWPARVQAVTAADVQRVARRYLRNYAVALIMPEE